MLGPDVEKSRTGVLPRGRQVDGDIPGLEEAACGGPDRGHQQAAREPAAEGGSPFGGFGLERLDRGHTADHEPVVGTGAQGIKRDIQGVLVAGELKVDERQQQGLGTDSAQGADKVRRTVWAPGDKDPGAVRGAGVEVSGTVPSHELKNSADQDAARSAMSAAPRASRTSASSIPSRVAPTSVSPSVAFLSRTVAVPSTAQTTASRCSRLPLR